MTRVYLGTTLSEVARWRGSGEVPAGTMARAVTADVVQALGDSDDEEREYAVTQLAADDAADRAGDEERIAVLVAERAGTEPAGDAGSVRIGAAIPWRDVVAILVDLRAPAGSRPAGGDGPEDHELAWYTPAELDSLTRGDV